MREDSRDKARRAREHLAEAGEHRLGSVAEPRYGRLAARFAPAAAAGRGRWVPRSPRSAAQGLGSGSFTEGEGGFVITTAGVAGVLSGKASLGVGPVDAGGNIIIR